ncbi:MAG: right-handed parallel beta-helix repeat-containing protein [Saprospiraceae bacterium]
MEYQNGDYQIQKYLGKQKRINCMSLYKTNILLFTVFIFIGCKTNSHSLILNQNPGKGIPTNSTKERTRDVSERYYSNSGAEYLTRGKPLLNFNNGQPDGISVLKIDNQYAILQAKDAYLFSWFKIGNENDDITLQRAIDFIYHVRNNDKNISNGVINGNDQLSTTGTIVVDKTITLKNTVEIYENITLKGDFTASNDHNFRSNTIFLDLNNETRSAIKFIRFPGSQMNYVSAKIEGIRFSALSPCKSAVDMEGASGNVMKDVMISGNRILESGIEISNAIFCKVSNVRVEKVKKYGLYVKKTKGSISTTTEIEHFNVNGATHGVFVEHKSCNSLWLKNCTIEMTDHSAIKIEQYNTVHIDNLYTENVPNETYKNGIIPIIDVNAQNFGESNGNRGMVTISNSLIKGYHKTLDNRKIAGILVDNHDIIHVEGCKFYLVDHSIIMRSNCNAVNWISNFEVGLTHNVFNVINSEDPKLYGIEKPDAFNIISSYSGNIGTYGPFTRVVSQKSRLFTPILLSRGNNRLRIAEEGIDEKKHFTEMWVQYGQQPGELRIAPGGKNVAATFGTDGGMTIGNILNAPPPKDGLRVHGQTIFGQGIVEKSAAVQVESTDKGFLPPRMTTKERNAIVSPAAGLIIFNTTNNKHQGYNGKMWNDLY